jgi:predicted nucleotidyltransferase
MHKILGMENGMCPYSPYFPNFDLHLQRDMVLVNISRMMTSMNRKESIEKICKDFAIDILYVFGSRSKEVVDLITDETLTLSQGLSDVDIGVRLIPGKKLTVKEKSLLSIALENLFGVTRVDLVILSDADPFLAANIIRGERLYAGDEYRADEFELYIMRRAGDLVPLENERERLIFKEEL